MSNDPEVSGDLRRLADRHQPQPVDLDAVLARGRRGLRRRRYLSAGGSVVGIAAIALTAASVPGWTAAKQNAQPAGVQSENSQFSPVPGVPRGEAGADQHLAKDEATRRCALKTPNEKVLLRGSKFRSGWKAMSDAKPGVKFMECTVPGGDRPSPALIKAAAKDLVPTSTADKLRNCSVAAWVDVTHWRVVASDEIKGKAASLVAVSPSGNKAIGCELERYPVAMPPGAETSTWFLTLDKLGESDPVFDPASGSDYRDVYLGGGSGGPCGATSCKGWNESGWGRVSSKAVKVSFRIGNLPAYTVPVGADGWFAYTWNEKGSYPRNQYPKVTAYDSHGKVVKKFAS
ncbi:hypothetical protein ACIA49_05160 [Kribbella sp. NPDC051587]|uniref:hypothetical protein n=1 Tax=Kribbella sp. NPDC051587 TaxID=3364119 RepID=UPI0037A2D1F9